MGLMLLNGCSHTAGSEIEYELQSTCHEKAWGKWLSDMTGDEYLNIAKPGASNEYIYRTTQDWIIENVFLNKIYKKEDLHVVVMWSGFDRKEVYFSDTNNVDNVNPASDPKLYITNMQFEIKRLQQTIVYFHDYLYSSLMNLMLINKLSNFLDTYEIKHTFLNSLHSFIGLEELNNDHMNHRLYQSYYNNLWLYNDDKKEKHIGFLNENETFFYHLKTNFKIPNHSLYKHYGEDAHKYWAKKVYDLITNPPKKPKRNLI